MVVSNFHKEYKVRVKIFKSDSCEKIQEEINKWLEDNKHNLKPREKLQNINNGQNCNFNMVCLGELGVQAFCATRLDTP